MTLMTANSSLSGLAQYTLVPSSGHVAIEDPRCLGPAYGMVDFERIVLDHTAQRCGGKDLVGKSHRLENIDWDKNDFHPALEGTHLLGQNLEIGSDSCYILHPIQNYRTLAAQSVVVEVSIPEEAAEVNIVAVASTAVVASIVVGVNTLVEASTAVKVNTDTLGRDDEEVGMSIDVVKVELGEAQMNTAEVLGVSDIAVPTLSDVLGGNQLPGGWSMELSEYEEDDDLGVFLNASGVVLTPEWFPWLSGEMLPQH